FGRGQLGRGLLIGLAKESDTSNPSAAAQQPSIGRARSTAAPQEAGVSAAATPGPAAPAFGRGISAFGRGAVPQPSGDSAATGGAVPSAASTFGRGFGRGGVPPAAAAATAALPEAMSRMSVQGAPTQHPAAAAARPERTRRPQIGRVGPEDKTGKTGQRVTVGTNFLRVEGADTMVYQYSITFNPSVDSRMQRDRLVLSIQDPEFQKIPGRVPSGNSLYTNRPLPRESAVYQAASGNMRVAVQLQLVGTATLSSLPSVYNIIFRSIQARMDLIEVRRHYYNPHAGERVPGHQMEVWPGYITSVSHVDGGLRLMIESSHRVVRSQTVYDLFQSVGTSLSNMTDAIVGTSVVTRYNNKIMRVDQVETSMDCTHTFERNGTQMSFLDYYRQAYNIEIQDPQQPLLISRSKPVRGKDGKTLEQRQICLVPELCYVTGLTDAMRRDFRLMRDLAKFTKLSPDRRLMELRKFVQTINNRPECRQLLDAWGLRLLEEPEVVPARRFVNERVLFGGGGRGPFAPVPVGQTSEFKRALADNRVLIDGKLLKWLVVYPAREERTIASFCETMMKKCRAMGITVAQPSTVALPNDSSGQYQQAIKQHFTTDLNLVCAVFTSQREERYNMVKRLCCTELVVPSQCLWTKTIGDPKKMGSVAVNVAAQINVKLGGALWGIEIPYDRFMMLGIDVYHADKARTTSYTGIVASVDQACTRWYSRVATQRHGQEILDSMRVIVQSQIAKYMQTVGAPPNVIFVFRDGVSDKQIGEVQQQEVKAIYAAIRGYDPSYRPKLVFMVVQKRINQRLFLLQGNNFSNPPPGTVLDHSITRPEMMDFFLVPQHVTQGTVTPTHYIVVECAGDIPVDEIQQLTFRSCHLYYNWAGSIRVPAPCQYAHKLVYMVGQNIATEPAEAICDRLFYL
uniref:PIWI-like protein 3 n=2 Tax=Macrostomum lignano TaxID=282301 RepID=A0A1I8IBU2_9PLAT